MNVGLIVAAGQGTRMGKPEGKQFLSIMGKPALAHTLFAFEQATRIDKVIVITIAENVERVRSLADEFSFAKIGDVVIGGEHRQDSVRLGLEVTSGLQDVKYVAIHDGARVLVTPDIIDSTISSFSNCDGVVAGIQAKDTIKLVRDGLVVKTLNRSESWQIQTPQVFEQDFIYRVHERAFNEGFYGTDDAMLVEHYGGRVKVIEGSEENIKITTLTDVFLAEAILMSRIK